MALLPNVVTVLQVENAQLRPDGGENNRKGIFNTNLKFETSGYKWSRLYHGDFFAGDETTAAVYDIRAESSASSLPARLEKDNVHARILTDASVQWSVPIVDRISRTKHAIVSSPDLSPLLEELRGLRDWSQTSTITLVLTPHADSRGGREYKLLTSRVDELVQSLDEIILFFIACPIQLYLLQRTRLFEGNDGLDDAPQERSDRVDAKFRRAFVIAYFGCAVVMFPFVLSTLIVKLQRDIAAESIIGSIEAVGMMTISLPLYWWHLAFFPSFWFHFVSESRKEQPRHSLRSLSCTTNLCCD